MEPWDATHETCGAVLRGLACVLFRVSLQQHVKDGNETSRETPRPPLIT